MNNNKNKQGFLITFGNWDTYNYCFMFLRNYYIKYNMHDKALTNEISILFQNKKIQLFTKTHKINKILIKV